MRYYYLPVTVKSETSPPDDVSTALDTYTTYILLLVDTPVIDAVRSYGSDEVSVTD